MLSSIDPVLLSRIQFAFTVSFHIIFPTFTVGLAAWLAFLEGCSLMTGKPVYRRLFDFWLKIFAVAFGLGVVSGIVLAFEFGSNWSELARRTGPIQGPLLGYESDSAFALEAAFFGVVIFGRGYVSRPFYFVACVLVALGTSLSAFWILVNNSWMQAPVGFTLGPDGVFIPTDWAAIIFSPVVWVRFPHMLMASYVTTAFCIAATGAWYLLRHMNMAEARVMMRMSLGLAAVMIPIQLFFGHLTGDYVHDWQPAKFAAIEGRWHDEQPASEVVPLGFIATLAGWFTAEVGRQPWTVYGQMLTSQAATPFLTSSQVATSLVVFVAIYLLIFIAGVTYVGKLLWAGIPRRFAAHVPSAGHGIDDTLTGTTSLPPHTAAE